MGMDPITPSGWGKASRRPAPLREPAGPVLNFARIQAQMLLPHLEDVLCISGPLSDAEVLGLAGSLDIQEAKREDFLALYHRAEERGVSFHRFLGRVREFSQSAGVSFHRAFVVLNLLARALGRKKSFLAMGIVGGALAKIPRDSNLQTLYKEYRAIPLSALCPCLCFVRKDELADLERVLDLFNRVFHRLDKEERKKARAALTKLAAASSFPATASYAETARERLLRLEEGPVAAKSFLAELEAILLVARIAKGPLLIEFSEED